MRAAWWVAIVKFARQHTLSNRPPEGKKEGGGRKEREGGRQGGREGGREGGSVRVHALHANTHPHANTQPHT
jgi:hypothetical protein